jgi:hypothetical protein
MRAPFSGRPADHEQCDGNKSTFAPSSDQAARQTNVAHCLNCGAELPARRQLKTFCNYACREQFQAAKAIGVPSGLRGSKNTKQLKALRSLKRRSIAGFAFTRINEVTYRVDTRAKLSAGWIMDTGWPGNLGGRWVARVGKRTSWPLPLDEAKRAAIAMLKDPNEGHPSGGIAELNQLAVRAVELAKKADFPQIGDPWFPPPEDD